MSAPLFPLFLKDQVLVLLSLFFISFATQASKDLHFHEFGFALGYGPVNQAFFADKDGRGADDWITATR